MTNKTCDCPTHGKQGIGLVCTHIAHAVDTNEKVGFFWGDDTDLACPDAWCEAGEGADDISEQWFRDADFKVFCSACWDQAKQVCGGFAE
jgi:hypothetical protein